MHNPWYLLATLYGVPGYLDHDLKKKNRAAWNRYFAANLGEKTRRKLIEEKRHLAEELTPFPPEELQEVSVAFAERCKRSAKTFTLPASDAAIDFSNVVFDQDCLFTGYLFSGFANFSGAAFSGAAFSGPASFDGATFSGVAFFGGATFSGLAFFDGATFYNRAVFDGATFSGVAFFGGATFSGVAFFGGATFSGLAFFDGATFSDRAVFDGATFSDRAIFKTTFSKATSFVNSEMKNETSFVGAKFLTKPPKFFNAKLHQGTVWRGIEPWPLPRRRDEAGAFIDAYACLKLEMDRLKKHEDELNFFALELQARQIEQGFLLGLPIAIYGAFSDYGRSYLRPLIALFFLALTGTLAFLTSDALLPSQSLGLSFANTLNVFGFRKDFFEPAVIARLPAWLDVVAAFQTIFGAILLFLFGLGIRNKFRMK